ncbi:hypothetical protein RFI_31130, partial [Reticulomyxa filosa]
TTTTTTTTTTMMQGNTPTIAMDPYERIAVELLIKSLDFYFAEYEKNCKDLEQWERTCEHVRLEIERCDQQVRAFWARQCNANLRQWNRLKDAKDKALLLKGRLLLQHMDVLNTCKERCEYVHGIRQQQQQQRMCDTATVGDTMHAAASLNDGLTDPIDEHMLDWKDVSKRKNYVLQQVTRCLQQVYMPDDTYKIPSRVWLDSQKDIPHIVTLGLQCALEEHARASSLSLESQVDATAASAGADIARTHMERDAAVASPGDINAADFFLSWLRYNVEDFTPNMPAQAQQNLLDNMKILVDLNFDPKRLNEIMQVRTACVCMCNYMHTYTYIYIYIYTYICIYSINDFGSFEQEQKHLPKQFEKNNIQNILEPVPEVEIKVSKKIESKAEKHDSNTYQQIVNVEPDLGAKVTADSEDKTDAETYETPNATTISMTAAANTTEQSNPQDGATFEQSEESSAAHQTSQDIFASTLTQPQQRATTSDSKKHTEFNTNAKVNTSNSSPHSSKPIDKKNTTSKQSYSKSFKKSNKVKSYNT